MCGYFWFSINVIIIWNFFEIKTDIEAEKEREIQMDVEIVKP